MLERLASPFKFTAASVAAVAVVIYAALFTSVLVFDDLPRVPKNTCGLDLDRAYEALSVITSRPHPFISHANDDVREYILARLKPLADSHDYVHLSDDRTSNVTYIAAEDHAVYFEGTNVLLKIDGTDTRLASRDSKPDGVLFSCHYDSVSTAPGATDDGMGVVTVLEMAEYFAHPERRPRRTAIFFFNNGEEDQLNGAHAYFEHPWSNLASTFINLEGAASGGRPVVFRSTSLGVAQSLLHSAVQHPHGNVLTSDAFSAGLIRSSTDYEIYARGVEGEAEGLQGFDFAFYKNRAYYHTRRDSIPGMGHGEGRKALWSMMELVRGSALGLLNGDDSGKDVRRSVYFDILGRSLLLFSMDAFYAFNILFLIIGPMSTVGLLAWVILSAKHHSSVDSVSENVVPPGFAGKLKVAVKALAGWERFWLALIVSVVAHTALVAAFVKLNPYTVHSGGYTVLAVFLATSYLALVVPLQALHYFLPPTFVSQKLAVTLSLYSFSWLLLLVSTVAISTKHLGSLYWVNPLYLGAWLAVVLELVRAGRIGDPGNERGYKSELFSTHEEREAQAEGEVSGRRLVRGVLYEAPSQQEDGQTNGDHAEAGEEVETAPTEITPLMHQHRRISHGGGEYVTLDPPEAIELAGKQREEYGWWIAQILVLVPATVILVLQLEVLLLNALQHTLVDGSSPALVYRLLALFSVLVFVPVTPFAHKLPQSLNAAVAALLVVLLVGSWTTFPFTQVAPFRVYFQQSVEVTSSISSPGLAINPLVSTRADAHHSTVVSAETTLTGLKGYIDRYITSGIPSSWNANVSCDPKGLRPDLMTCKWATGLLPSPYGNISVPPGAPSASPRVHWLDVETERLNATRALISIRGENTRGCRLYFDQPITYIDIRSSGRFQQPGKLQGGYEMPQGGVKEARLWSRTWGKTFVVEVGWEPESSGGSGEPELSGRAACEWAEYASATQGQSRSGTIPAFEEVEAFLPLWALPTKLADGLVEVWTTFVV
ncbi:hypothetical protein BD310DRAFT_931826 [Dichomitus squalens]|uniref:Peptide hydrolase n=1 Tax=Dichomitus squalens TaxID=114155 RepID=A0A4Q9PPN8_9APHY|nr:hypothetical protein BD310DRAFT_931826 [Dichomitus squalens]